MPSERVTIVADVTYESPLTRRWKLTGTYEVYFDGKPLDGAVSEAVHRYAAIEKRTDLPKEWYDLSAEDAVKLWQFVWRWSDLPDEHNASLTTVRQGRECERKAWEDLD